MAFSAIILIALQRGTKEDKEMKWVSESFGAGSA
jgi:hypothetical protein